MPSTEPNSLLALETPRLILDLDRLERNCAAMRTRCAALGVALRAHLKTAKSVDVARIATNASGITVSTLKEAEHFARAGYRDILYGGRNRSEQARARGAHPGSRRRPDPGHGFAGGRCGRGALCGRAKRRAPVSHRDRLRRAPWRAAVRRCRHCRTRPRHRGRAGLRLRGVMTHAGHSYDTNDPAKVVPIAAAERDAAVDAARRSAPPACRATSSASARPRPCCTPIICAA
jgi:D-serine deaminase-like pyridoxal phosphate-dependent protein